MDTIIGPYCLDPPGSGGFGFSAWRQLYPALQRLTEIPRFVAALKMDYWLQANRPWWETPDLLGDEAATWQELQALLPELTPFGKVERGNDSDETCDFRQRCRWAALRTLAAATGVLASTYEFLPGLGGDAVVEISLQGLRCRIGKLSSWTLAATPAQSDMTLTLLNETSILSNLEKIFFPFLADALEVETHFARWSAWAPLRRWQSSFRFPLLARGSGTGTIPLGYLPRYTTADIASSGVPFATAALFASPLAADCVPSLQKEEVAAIEFPAAISLLDWALERARERETLKLSSGLTI